MVVSIGCASSPPISIDINKWDFYIHVTECFIATFKSTLQSCWSKSTGVKMKQEIYSIDPGTPGRGLFKRLERSLQHFQEWRSLFLNNSAAKVTTFKPSSSLSWNMERELWHPSLTLLHSTTVISLWACSKKWLCWRMLKLSTKEVVYKNKVNTIDETSQAGSQFQNICAWMRCTKQV